MPLDLGIHGSAKDVSGPQAWWVEAGDVRLMALEDGAVVHTTEGHLFVMVEATGHLMIDGDLGTFCHAWPSWGRAKGQSLASFLTTVGYDYFMRKAARQAFEEVDVPLSILEMKREVLRDRRAGHIEKGHAREIWNDMRDYLSDDMMEGEFLRELGESPALYETFLSDGPAPVRRRQIGTARRFWDETWTTFRDKVLTPMVERERASAKTNAMAA